MLITFNKHYKKAQAIRRGFVPYNHEEYEMHVRNAYAYVEYAGMLDSDDTKVCNIIKMYKELRGGIV